MSAEFALKSIIRVLVVDDHELVRSQLVAMLLREQGIELVGVASNGKEAIQLALFAQPDVVVMDVYMPELDGISATREIRSSPDAPSVVMLSMDHNAALVRHARKNGAAAYVHKQNVGNELIPTIRSAYQDRLSL